MGSRFFRVFLVCFLVCMLVCSPALAASTTESQIMMMSDEDDLDSGISLMSIDDSSGTLRYRLELLAYDPFTFDWAYVGASNYVDVGTATSVSVPEFTYNAGLKYFFAVRFYEYKSDGSGRVCAQGKNYNVRFGRLNFSCRDLSTNISRWFNASSGSDSFAFFSSLYETNYFVKYPVTSFSFYQPSGGGFGFYQSFNSPVSAFYYASVFSFDASNFGFDEFVDGNSYSLYFATTASSPMLSSDSSGVGGSDGSLDSSVQQTTNAVNQVNQSIKQTISAVQQVSADLAALSSAVQQYTQQVLSGIEQQTNAISSLVTAQIQQIRQDLGLVNDNLSSGFSSVTNSITNQTQQVTQKIDTLQQNVVNKLDTVNQSITDLSDVTQKGFDDVKKGITDLPGKIGEMLKSLIVPDSEQLADKYSDFTDLAEEKLGVIYQVPEMVFEMAQTVVDGVTNQETQMQLPAFKLVMPDAEYTLWEEQKFDIWPAGTEAIQNAVQLATSMLCVILTFNSLKRKYEEWLDGR